MSLEGNKILGAVLLAGLVAMLAAFTAELFVEPEALEKPAYVVAGVGEESTGGPVVAAVAEPVSALLAKADAAHGAVLAKACAACHDFTKGGPNKVGPNLYGIIGNHHAHKDDFAYSDGMKAKSGETWDYETINTFLFKPKAAVAGTKMAFAGMPKVQDRADVIAFLRTLADSPKPLP